MAERLNGLIDQQRSFAADASHQLRTPLTALRLKLERARDLIHEDPVGAEARLAAAESEADRLGSIIEGLLLLARTEANTTATERVDVAAVARARTEHWMALAEESGVRIGYHGAEHAAALALPGAVEQVVDNYIDNALSVSPAGGTIVVSVESGARTVDLHVLDDGPGMSAEDRLRAFDRFWRGASPAGGSGLGLAIVAQLMAASGGAAELQARPEGGLDASATFPSA